MGTNVNCCRHTVLKQCPEIVFKFTIYSYTYKLVIFRSLGNKQWEQMRIVVFIVITYYIDIFKMVKLSVPDDIHIWLQFNEMSYRIETIMLNVRKPIIIRFI